MSYLFQCISYRNQYISLTGDNLFTPWWKFLKIRMCVGKRVNITVLKFHPNREVQFWDIDGVGHNLNLYRTSSKTNPNVDVIQITHFHRNNFEMLTYIICLKKLFTELDCLYVKSFSLSINISCSPGLCMVVLSFSPSFPPSLSSSRLSLALLLSLPPLSLLSISPSPPLSLFLSLSISLTYLSLHVFLSLSQILSSY